LAASDGLNSCEFSSGKFIAAACRVYRNDVSQYAIDNSEPALIFRRSIMFELFRNQSRSAAGAIKYVTVGTLLIIWAGLWYYYFLMPVPNAPAWQKYACVGTILSGIAIAAIGLLFGLIGRGAKAADTTVAATSSGEAASVAQVIPTNLRTPGDIGTPITAAVPVSTAAVNELRR